MEEEGARKVNKREVMGRQGNLFIIFNLTSTIHEDFIGTSRIELVYFFQVLLSDKQHGMEGRAGESSRRVEKERGMGGRERWWGGEGGSI